jgi:uncharacterized integral membrane protein
MNARIVLILILVGLVVVFVVQNAEVVELRFLFWTAAMSRALLLFIVLALGILIGWLLRGHVAHRWKRTEIPSSTREPE